ncbi:hypothetical protein BGZ57DRAFT_1014739 [Hyaloscypha finlandica]|nr:hypothetical protein BGZ57DRAFT_1014739 [Hyaloscypha finlandica]
MAIEQARRAFFKSFKFRLLAFVQRFFNYVLLLLHRGPDRVCLCDGRFNNFKASSDISPWSWLNQVGPYQYYIHGSDAITYCVNLDPSFKNPADTGSTRGAKLTLGSISFWNGRTMRGKELIHQTTAAINKRASYHTDLKSGWISGESGTSDPLLRWDIGGSTKWSTNWTAINLGSSVALWHSTGSDPLTLTVPAHLGVLELPVSGRKDSTEDFFLVGCILRVTLTKTVTGPAGASSRIRRGTT